MASEEDEILSTTTEEESDIMEEVELEVLKESIQGKAKNTIRSYERAYKHLREALGKEVHASSQKLIIEVSKEISSNHNTRAQLINMGIIMRKLYNLDVKELEQQRKMNKKNIAMHTKEQNKLLKPQLPTLQEFDEHLDYLFQKSMYAEFIINYMIRHLCTRNQDLVFEVVKRRADVKDDHKNYIWHGGRGKAVFYRRDYKTDKTYKEKINVFQDKRLLMALSKAKHPIIKNADQVGYYVKKATFKELGEGALMKVIVNDARERGDLNELTRISKDRGTDLCTIATSYNVQD